MKKRKYLKLTITALGVIIIAGVLFGCLIFNSGLVKYLSRTSRIDGQILVVEGWLPEYALKEAFNEYSAGNYERVVTTGIKAPDLDFCLMGMGGYLIFYTGTAETPPSSPGNHIIEFTAHSEMGGIYSTHINLYVNDSLIADFIADEHIRQYSADWMGSVSDIDSVMVQFDNDAFDQWGDRNLYVKEVIIDKKDTIPFQFNSVFDAGELDTEERIINDYRSHAEIARNRLISMGIDSAKVIALPGSRVRINRTLTSALAFREWLKVSGSKTNDINVISLGIHARRTWLTYSKILGRKFNTGIISLPEVLSNDDLKSRKKEILIETASLVAYRFLLVFY